MKKIYLKLTIKKMTEIKAPKIQTRRYRLVFTLSELVVLINVLSDNKNDKTINILNRLINKLNK